jgi:hypothetical protein
MKIMEKSINELRIRSKRLLKSAKQGDKLAFERLAKFKKVMSEETLKLKHCQNVVACESGFSNWQHAKRILGRCIDSKAFTSSQNDDIDMGTLWYNNECSSLMNLWFTDYLQAKAAANQNKNCYIIPYKKQFIVVEKSYIKTLNLLDGLDELWTNLNGDLVATYPSILWDEMAYEAISRRNKTN